MGLRAGFWVKKASSTKPLSPPFSHCVSWSWPGNEAKMRSTVLAFASALSHRKNILGAYYAWVGASAWGESLGKSLWGNSPHSQSFIGRVLQKALQ
jgi:hypothetical protein